MPKPFRSWIALPVGLLALAGFPAAGFGVAPAPGDPIRIPRVDGAIAVDGDLGDEGWRGAAKVEKWYETNPGDNIEPAVRSVAYLSYDDRYLYAGFEFFDPDAKRIRAPYGDRDSVNSAMDFGGVVLSTNGDGKTAVEFFANPRGIQYDAIQSDVSGEDSSPDYYWDSAGRVHDDRWTLEIRIPFSSLRYPPQPTQKWGVILYRNYPRDRRYQIFSARLPREVSCFICNSSPLTGLENLPPAGGFVIAPYGTARGERTAVNGPGTSLEPSDPEYTGGVDAKWTPSEDTALDATLNPDFSQIESDVAAISTNERFAIFYPEKRPFFLEGKDLFATPFNAVYTRTLNDPRWGGRATGKSGATSYTALVTEDQGGGLVILPGSNNSGFAPEDFSSINTIARGRRDFGSSFGSFLLTDREIEGGGYNRVFGPDFQWRPNAQDWVTGQFLYSASETPDRPDLAAEWDGRNLSGHAGTVQWFRGTATYDLTLQANDIADGFRADLGFLPQVGIREGYGEYGYTIHPTGFLSRLRTFLGADYTADREGNLVFQQVAPGMGMDGRGNTFMRYRVLLERVATDAGPLSRTRLEYTLQASLSRVFNRLELTGWVGEEIDFANSRPGHGARVSLNGTFRPTDHLELALNSDYRFLDVMGGQRLFTAQVERLKATYTFSPRSFLRLIGQHVRTDRNPDLYTFAVPAHEGALSSSILYAYKLNWQTVFYAGYGDEKALTDQREYQPDTRSLFLKLSYAFQR